jgi:chemotaxis protein CheX
LNILSSAAAGAQAVPRTLKQELLEPFIDAVTLTFSEMAGAEVSAQGVYQKGGGTTLGEVSAVLRLAGTDGTLVLGFPRTTALALTERILASLPEAADENMQNDCVGEIANVVAGQAKALLAATPYHFYFSTPTVLTGLRQDISPRADRKCLIVVFGSELGDFALQLLLQH